MPVRKETRTAKINVPVRTSSCSSCSKGTTTCKQCNNEKKTTREGFSNTNTRTTNVKTNANTNNTKGQTKKAKTRSTSPLARFGDLARSFSKSTIGLIDDKSHKAMDWMHDKVTKGHLKSFSNKTSGVMNVAHNKGLQSGPVRKATNSMVGVFDTGMDHVVQKSPFKLIANKATHIMGDIISGGTSLTSRALSSTSLTKHGKGFYTRGWH